MTDKWNDKEQKMVDLLNKKHKSGLDDWEIIYSGTTYIGNDTTNKILSNSLGYSPDKIFIKNK